MEWLRSAGNKPDSYRPRRFHFAWQQNGLRRSCWSFGAAPGRLMAILSSLDSHPHHPIQWNWIVSNCLCWAVLLVVWGLTRVATKNTVPQQQTASNIWCFLVSVVLSPPSIPWNHVSSNNLCLEELAGHGPPSQWQGLPVPGWHLPPPVQRESTMCRVPYGPHL